MEAGVIEVAAAVKVPVVIMQLLGAWRFLWGGLAKALWRAWDR